MSEREWRVMVRRPGREPRSLYRVALAEDDARKELDALRSTAVEPPDTWLESRDVGPWERVS